MSIEINPTPEPSILGKIGYYLDYIYDIFDDYLDDFLDISIGYLNYFSFALLFLEYGSKLFNLRFNKLYSFIINVIIQSLITVSLLVKFNPFHPKLTISELDKKLVFSAAIYLFINLFSDIYKYVSEVQARQKERAKKRDLEKDKNKKNKNI